AFYVIAGMVVPDITKADVAIPLKKTITIYTSATDKESVYKAVIALQHDIEKVTGSTASIKNLSAIREPGIVVLNSIKDKLQQSLTGWEAHRVYTAKINGSEQVVLQGADLRGTIYAIYEFSEKILGVPPLWYFINWKPEVQKAIIIPSSLDIKINKPTVKYRAWFPNDMDMFSPWRKLNKDNKELWLETALRHKINTIEYYEKGTYSDKTAYKLSDNFRLISSYGLVLTTHHHSPLNA